MTAKQASVPAKRKEKKLPALRVEERGAGRGRYVPICLGYSVSVGIPCSTQYAHTASE